MKSTEQNVADGKETSAANEMEELIQARFTRRQFLQGTLNVAAQWVFFANVDLSAKEPPRDSLLGFQSIPISHADEVIVPPGYVLQVVSAWGDPVVAGAPEFRDDATQSAEVQAVQAGMGHDGMYFFPLPFGSKSSNHGLLAVNYEYVDDHLLFPDGQENWSAEKVQKSKNAHGIGVLEIRFDGKKWSVVKNSKYGRRITADTPFEVSGPAAGHALMKTSGDPSGKRVLGTWNNCAYGVTPWNTYLSCEENVTPYFINQSKTVPRLHDRYGVGEKTWGFRWHEFDARFNAEAHPNEPNRHGWVVEVDPFDPKSVPVKRTALGRMAHEGATLSITRDGRVAYYMGDDDFRSKFEHIYKFVSKKPFVPDGKYSSNRDILDDGTLYAAKFHADGTGEWLELKFENKGLTAEDGFASQAEVLIDARTAADKVGATYMDRPEWIAIHPITKEAYCSLTNNTARGQSAPLGQTEVLGEDSANPRAPNPMGHIIRWKDGDGDPASTRFRWDIFLLCGDPQSPDATKRGEKNKGLAFAQPDGLSFDQRGVLWIQTDSSAKNMAQPDWKNIGNNQMLAADPGTGDIRRFLTGPIGCEITGLTWTPDGKTMFVNIQHPGEPPMEHPGRNDPKKPKAISSWPDGAKGGRPRSATIAIRRRDGGIVGT
jgi:secreted PhoX family phosphatase